jgi:hypothetical protein
VSVDVKMSFLNGFCPAWRVSVHAAVIDASEETSPIDVSSPYVP